MSRDMFRRLVLLLVGGLLLATVLGCQTRHKFTESKLREAAEQFAFPQATLQETELLLDTSASMRGFALAAVEDKAAPANSWQSLFVGINSLPHHFFAQAGSHAGVRPAAPKEPAPDTASLPSPPSGQGLRLMRFGGSVESLDSSVSLLPLMLGMQPVTPIGQGALSAAWRSRPCGQSRSSGGSVRDAIDTLFSEKETCLGLAFDRATAPPADRSLRIVLTDSEQAADDSPACPMGNNPAPTQDRLYDWVHNRDHFGAIAVFRLPYQGWKVSAPTKDYCECGSRNLFAYLLGPSADVVEDAYTEIADQWEGSAAEIAYLPLAPRPASQYAVKMTIYKTKDGNVPASIDDSAQQILKPESGHLPMFFFRVDKESVVVSFEVSKVALEDAHLRRSPGGLVRPPLSQALAWRDRPSLLEVSAPTKDSKGGALRLTQGDGAFEFVHLPEPPKGPLVAHTRDAQYLSRELKVAEEELSDVKASGSWEVRKRQGAKHACEVYLFELYARGGELVKHLIAETPLLQSRDRACSGLDSIAAQVRHVYQETPIVRFLLHIDA
jgi:hypothetical protein